MTTPDISTVVSLFNRSRDLEFRGHVARAAELRSRTLAAAQALGAEDCLIVAQVQLEMANTLALPKKNPATTGDEEHFVFQLSKFWFEISPVVLRRKAAGTLVAGACRPSEVAWFEQTRVHIAQPQRGLGIETLCTAQASDNTIARIGPFVGYETLLATADLGFVLLHYCDLDFTVAQEHAALTLAAVAADELIKPHALRAQHFMLSAETVFAKHVRTVAQNPPRVKPENAGALRALMLASCRVAACSGLLAGSIQKLLEMQQGVADRKDSAAAAASAAPGLRTCALACCGAKEAHPQHFKSCAACKTVVYCSKEHQVKDWHAHKAACKAARKVATTAQSQTGSSTA